LTSSATHWARKSKPEAEIKIETEGEGEGEGPLFASKTKKGLSAAHDGDTEKNDVLAVLARLDELRQRTSAENGREAKVSIVREYEDLRELLS
jgi:hypothetical protein